MKLTTLLLTFLWGLSLEAHSSVLANLKLTNNDSVLVLDQSGKTLFSWKATKPLVPASLVKLATAHLAINKWGLEYRFHTDFLIDGDTLWVKGYGDPFLVSEEIDSLVVELKARLGTAQAVPIKQLNIDNSYFDIKSVPGRSSVADPYNAPMSALSANFNTASLKKRNGRIESAEAQTPLTDTAKKLAGSMTRAVERVNLLNATNAQFNFAELLLAKLAWSDVDIKIDQTVNADAQLLYRHQNSHTLADILKGTLEFSNNFMANQVFLSLADDGQVDNVSFTTGRDYSNSSLAKEFGWQAHIIDDGSGLSRKNRLNAEQISDLLTVLEPNKTLLKKIDVKSKFALVYAKTGTLNDVRSYAGYIELPSKVVGKEANKYRFVFNFNRTVPYRYRDQLLEQLINDLEGA